MGALTTLMNLASGYLVYGNPYMALHMLARMLTEDICPSDPPPRRIPSFLYEHTYYIMTQAFFLLSRMQLGPHHPLYPGPFATPENGYPNFDCDPINDLLASMGMEFATAALPELELMTATYLDSLDNLIKTRNEIQCRPSYAVLYTYVGVVGRSEERASRSNSKASLTSVSSASGAKVAPSASTNSQKSSSSSSTSSSGLSSASTVTPTSAAALMASTPPADDPGLWSGMDLARQKYALTSAMGGKADWVLASRFDLTNDNGKRYYKDGTAKMDRAAKEFVKAISSTGAMNPFATLNHQGFTRGEEWETPDFAYSGPGGHYGGGGGASSSHGGGGSSLSSSAVVPSAPLGDQGLIATFFDLAPISFACCPVEPLAPVADPANGITMMMGGAGVGPTNHAVGGSSKGPARYPSHGEPNRNSPLVGPLGSSFFAAGQLFALAGDTMAFAAYQLQQFTSTVEGSVNGGSGGAGVPVTSASVAARRFAERLDLLTLLKVPTRAEPARIHRELLAGATTMLCSGLGWCETCFKVAMKDPDFGVDVYFFSKGGVMPRAVGGRDGTLASNSGAHSKAKVVDGPIAENIDIATAKEDADVDWALVGTTTELIQAVDDGPQQAMRAIRNRLKSESAITVNVTLNVLDTFVKNCGANFRVELSTKENTSFIQRFLINEDLAPENRGRMLELISNWARQFSDPPELRRLYYTLLELGYRFPPPAHLVPQMGAAPQQVHGVVVDGSFPRKFIDIQSQIQYIRINLAAGVVPGLRPGGLDAPTRMARSASQRPASVVTHLPPEERRNYVLFDCNLADNNIQLLIEALHFADKNESLIKNEVVQEFRAKCREMHRRIYVLIAEVLEEDLLGKSVHAPVDDKLLKANGDLNAALHHYEEMLDCRAIEAATKASVVEAKAANPNANGGSASGASESLLGHDVGSLGGMGGAGAAGDDTQSPFDNFVYGGSWRAAIEVTCADAQDVSGPSHKDFTYDESPAPSDKKLG
ncbi:hypothetical protein HK101_001710 [Irineochytrium annulatum]|nr:hypothetical protein HK101_001710 [Irineochytrium annulatum]